MSGIWKRTNAREIAFRMIYQMDVGHNTLDVAEETLNEAIFDGFIHWRDREYVVDLVTGVQRQKEFLDREIAENLENWPADRVFAVERNILRLSIYEICFMGDIPFEVSVDEAVELAKKYGGEDDAYAFINGILDNAYPGREAPSPGAKERRRDEKDPS